MLKTRFSPSLMCADTLHLADDLDRLEAAGCDMLHVDIMDGRFVPNIVLGGVVIRAAREHARMPLDIHIMAEEPAALYDALDIREGDTVTVHAEACRHLHRALAALKARGARPGVALCPATPLSALAYVGDLLSIVLLMTVNPGFAGQRFIPAMEGKIKAARALLDAEGLNAVSVEVDGGIAPDNIAALRAAGADTFVLGTASLFNDNGTIEENAAHLRRRLHIESERGIS